MSAIFIGTVESSYEALDELLKNRVDIKAIFTVNQKYAKKISDYKALDSIAERFGINLYKFRNINDDINIQIMKKINPDVIFIIGLSQLVNDEILSIPRYGCIGAHPSKLPSYKGRAVIPWTIINDEKYIGMSLFYLEKEADTGDIIAQKTMEILEGDDSRSIYNKLMILLRKLLKENIEDIVSNSVDRIHQDKDMGCYCLKRCKEDGIIDWNKKTREIFNLIRAETIPYPGAFTFYNGKKIIIWNSEIIENYKLPIVGIPGQVIEIIKEKGVLIKTINGILMIKDIQVDGERINSSEYFKKVGGKLGMNFEREIEKLNNEIKLLKKMCVRGD